MLRPARGVRQERAAKKKSPLVPHPPLPCSAPPHTSWPSSRGSPPANAYAHRGRSRISPKRPVAPEWGAPSYRCALRIPHRKLGAGKHQKDQESVQFAPSVLADQNAPVKPHGDSRVAARYPAQRVSRPAPLKIGAGSTSSPQEASNVTGERIFLIRHELRRSSQTFSGNCFVELDRHSDRSNTFLMSLQTSGEEIGGRSGMCLSHATELARIHLRSRRSDSPLFWIWSRARRNEAMHFSTDISFPRHLM